MRVDGGSMLGEGEGGDDWNNRDRRRVGWNFYQLSFNRSGTCTRPADHRVHVGLSLPPPLRSTH